MQDNYLKYISLLNKILTNPIIGLEGQEKELIKELLKDCLNQTNYGVKTKEIFKTMIDNAKDSRELYYKMQAYAFSNDLHL